MIGIVLAGLSQASGIFVLLTFLNGLLEGAGFSGSSAFSQSVLVGAILAVFTLAALALVDRAGRKTLLILGTLMQFISMSAIACLYGSHGHGLAILLFFLIFVAAHAAGNGAVCWVIISEIFPTKVRGRRNVRRDYLAVPRRLYRKLLLSKNAGTLRIQRHILVLRAATREFALRPVSSPGNQGTLA